MESAICDKNIKIFELLLACNLDSDDVKAHLEVDGNRSVFRPQKKQNVVSHSTDILLPHDMVIAIMVIALDLSL